ncbi:NAD(P)/FAD-dependent oxidoreductase [candidate division KSB1 bacterium]|nr:NAD(P)/FAD-dependent oxidoreductase [candidate division KSB1 bacterium]
MKTFYDVIVVGGGPAGSWAAKHAAEGGASVLLLEKDREIGLPVRCAEGVGLDGLKEQIPEFPKSWIAQVIDGAIIVAPDGREVEAYSGEKGVVLHRKLFDAGLAQRASEAGAEVVTKANVHGLLMKNSQVCGVKVQHLGESYEIQSSIVIGADGIESRVGRWASIKTQTPFAEMESCAQMTLSNLDIDPTRVIFWIGKDIAPGGYFWLFPKGPGTANVGLGISGKFTKDKKAIHYLKSFIEKKYSSASILTIVAGGVPSGPQLNELVGNGLMLVGDAAHHTDPLSGGGIINALIGGKMAGEVAAESITKKDVTKKQLSRYQKQWEKQKKKELQLAYRIKNIIHEFKDEDFNKIADVVLELPLEKRTNTELFKVALRKYPKLILDMATMWIRSK